MRTQRRAPVTVILAHITTTQDMGNETEDATGTRVELAMFNPEQTLERSSTDQAPVVQPAFFDVPGVHDIDADDLVHVTDVQLPEDPDELKALLLTVTPTSWQVVGGGNVWLDRTKVPVVQPRSA